MGGTCVNAGCVPKKVMFNAATVNEMIHEAKHFGFTVGETTFDWNRLKVSRDAYIARLNGIYQRNLANNKIDVITGSGVFSGPNEVTVGKETYTADNILIAVGGKPFLPNIPGIEHCISSDGFFKLETQPKRVAVIGGGYIGVELCGVFHALGTKVDWMIREDRPLKYFDDLIVNTLLSEMKKQQLNLNCFQTPTEVRKNADKTLTMVTAGGQEWGPYDEILFATGRTPLTDTLNLEAAGVEVTVPNAPSTNKYIKVDEYQNTNLKGVYAVGDVCGRVELTPTAIAAGRRLADRLFGNMPGAKADYDNVPTVVFSHPTIGTCGLTEAQARLKFGDDKIKTYTSTFTNLWYGTYSMEPDEKPKTSMKLVCLLPDEKVVGLHSIGMGSDELLQGFGVAMKMGATKADLDSCIAIHPTAAEEMVTMAPWGMAPARSNK